jgi:hypothetical protein
MGKIFFGQFTCRLYGQRHICSLNREDWFSRNRTLSNENSPMIGDLKDHEKVTIYGWVSDPNTKRYLGADFNQTERHGQGHITTVQLSRNISAISHNFRLNTDYNTWF